VCPVCPEFDTVILAGGRAARLAGADKPGLVVGGAPMLVLVARAAAAAGTRRLIIVGPRRPGAVQQALSAAAAGLPGGLIYVGEEPPGSGPVPALRRGFAEVSAPWLALLAADLPFLTGTHVAAILAACHAAPSADSPAASARSEAGAEGAEGAPSGVSAGSAAAGDPAGVVLADDQRRPQWLAGAWRAASLRAALADYHGSSLHGLLGPLNPALMDLSARPGMPPPWLDCDTPADLGAARRALAAEPARATGAVAGTADDHQDRTEPR
jgi:molybdenum cofactor guanylyltransferase